MLKPAEYRLVINKYLGQSLPPSTTSTRFNQQISQVVCLSGGRREGTVAHLGNAWETIVPCVG